MIDTSRNVFGIFGQTMSEWNFALQLIKKNKLLLTSECQLAFENLSKSQINLN